MAKKAKVEKIRIVKGGAGHFEVGVTYDITEPSTAKLLLEGGYGVKVSGNSAYDDWLAQAHEFIKSEEDFMELAKQLGFHFDEDEDGEEGGEEDGG